MAQKCLSLMRRFVIVTALLSMTHHAHGKDIDQMPGFSNLDECVSVVLQNWIGDNSAACEPASSNSYNTIISNSVSFTCISAGQTPIAPQVITALDTFHVYCLDRLGDDDGSPSTADSPPTGTAASPGSRSPGPTVGSSAGSQTAASSNNNRSLALGCAIAIPIGVILIAGMIGWLIWRRRKSSRLVEMAQVQSNGPHCVGGSAPVYEAPAISGRKQGRYPSGRVEVSGQSAIKSELPGRETYAKPEQAGPDADLMGKWRHDLSHVSTTRHELPAIDRSGELEGDGENVIPRPLNVGQSGAKPFPGES